MKLKSLITALVTTTTLALTQSTSLSQSTSNQDVKFVCGTSRLGNVPTTYAWTSHGRIAVIRWESKDFKDAGYSPRRRCEQVSPRFQRAYNDGSLNFITNGKINGQKVICTARQVEGSCADILLTLQPQDKSLDVLQQLNDLLSGEAGGPVAQSSDPQVYIKLDIEKFLTTAPIERN